MPHQFYSLSPSLQIAQHRHQANGASVTADMYQVTGLGHMVVMFIFSRLILQLFKLAAGLI